VNLRPDQADNIIDPLLAQTDIGKILLEADVQLKKDTASFTSPNTPEGKEYWDKLYSKAEELYGSQNVTIPTLTRPWIVPGEIIIRESKDNAYIYKATLKVMLEDDYLKGSSTYSFDDPKLKELNTYASSLLREKIVPKLTQEVNTSKRYSALRQVYYSLVLAQWFKEHFSNKGGIYSDLIDRSNLNGLTSQEPWSKETYFLQYQKSFRDGEYNFKIPVTTPYGQSIRSYFSGGIDLMQTAPAINAGLVLQGEKQLPASLENNPKLQACRVNGPVAQLQITRELSPVAQKNLNQGSYQSVPVANVGGVLRTIPRDAASFDPVRMKRLKALADRLTQKRIDLCRRTTKKSNFEDALAVFKRKPDRLFLLDAPPTEAQLMSLSSLPFEVGLLRLRGTNEWLITNGGEADSVDWKFNYPYIRRGEVSILGDLMIHNHPRDVIPVESTTDQYSDFMDFSMPGIVIGKDGVTVYSTDEYSNGQEGDSVLNLDDFMSFLSFKLPGRETLRKDSSTGGFLREDVDKREQICKQYGIKTHFVPWGNKEIGELFKAGGSLGEALQSKVLKVRYRALDRLLEVAKSGDVAGVLSVYVADKSKAMQEKALDYLIKSFEAGEVSRANEIKEFLQSDFLDVKRRALEALLSAGIQDESVISSFNKMVEISSLWDLLDGMEPSPAVIETIKKYHTSKMRAINSNTIAGIKLSVCVVEAMLALGMADVLIDYLNMLQKTEGFSRTIINICGYLVRLESGRQAVFDFINRNRANLDNGALIDIAQEMNKWDKKGARRIVGMVPFDYIHKIFSDYKLNVAGSRTQFLISSGAIEEFTHSSDPQIAAVASVMLRINGLHISSLEEENAKYLASPQVQAFKRKQEATGKSSVENERIVKLSRPVVLADIYHHRGYSILGKTNAKVKQAEALLGQGRGEEAKALLNEALAEYESVLGRYIGETAKYDSIRRNIEEAKRALKEADGEKEISQEEQDQKNMEEWERQRADFEIELNRQFPGFKFASVTRRVGDQEYFRVVDVTGKKVFVGTRNEIINKLKEDIRDVSLIRNADYDDIVERIKVITRWNISYRATRSLMIIADRLKKSNSLGAKKVNELSFKDIKSEFELNTFGRIITDLIRLGVTIILVGMLWKMVQPSLPRIKAFAQEQLHNLVVKIESNEAVSSVLSMWDIFTSSISPEARKFTEEQNKMLKDAGLDYKVNGPFDNLPSLTKEGIKKRIEDNKEAMKQLKEAGVDTSVEYVPANSPEAREQMRELRGKDSNFSGSLAFVNPQAFASAWRQGTAVEFSAEHKAVLRDPAMGPDFKAPEVRLVSREVMNKVSPGHNVVRLGNQVLIVDNHWQAQSDQEKLDILMHEAMADWAQRKNVEAEDIAIDLEGLKVDEAKRRAAHKGQQADVSMDGLGVHAVGWQVRQEAYPGDRREMSWPLAPQRIDLSTLPIGTMIYLNTVETWVNYTLRIEPNGRVKVWLNGNDGCFEGPVSALFSPGEKPGIIEVNKAIYGFQYFSWDVDTHQLKDPRGKGMRFTSFPEFRMWSAFRALPARPVVRVGLAEETRRSGVAQLKGTVRKLGWLSAVLALVGLTAKADLTTEDTRLAAPLKAAEVFLTWQVESRDPDVLALSKKAQEIFNSKDLNVKFVVADIKEFLKSHPEFTKGAYAEDMFSKGSAQAMIIPLGENEYLMIYDISMVKKGISGLIAGLTHELIGHISFTKEELDGLSPTEEEALVFAREIKYLEALLNDKGLQEQFSGIGSGIWQELKEQLEKEKNTLRWLQEQSRSNKGRPQKERSLSNGVILGGTAIGVTLAAVLLLTLRKNKEVRAAPEKVKPSPKVESKKSSKKSANNSKTIASKKNRFEGVQGQVTTGDLSILGEPADQVIGLFNAGALTIPVTMTGGNINVTSGIVTVAGREIRIIINNLQDDFAIASADGSMVSVNLYKINALLKDSNLTDQEKKDAVQRVLIHDITEAYSLQLGFNEAEAHNAGMMAEAMHPANSQNIRDALSEVLKERDRRQADQLKDGRGFGGEGQTPAKRVPFIKFLAFLEPILDSSEKLSEIKTKVRNRTDLNAEVENTSFNTEFVRKEVTDKMQGQFSDPEISVRELVSNGVDASRAVAGGRAKVVVKLEGDRKLTVSDFGEGMDLDTILRVFIIPDVSGKAQGKGIGRFGIGFFSTFGFLRDNGDKIVVHTGKGGSESYKVTFIRQGGELFIDIEVLNETKQGTDVSVELASRDFNKPLIEKIVNDSFSFNLDTDIYLIDDQALTTHINNPDNYQSISLGDVQVGYTKEKTENGTGEIVIQVSGVTHFSLPTTGFGLPQRVIINLPGSIDYTIARNSVKIDKILIAVIKQLCQDIASSTQLLDSEKLQLLGALRSLVVSLQRQNNSLRPEDNFENILKEAIIAIVQTLQEKGYLLLPDVAAFRDKGSDSKILLLQPQLFLQALPYIKALAVFKSNKLQIVSEEVTVFMLDFSLLGEEAKDTPFLFDRQGKMLFLNTRHFDDLNDSLQIEEIKALLSGPITRLLALKGEIFRDVEMFKAKPSEKREVVLKREPALKRLRTGLMARELVQVFYSVIRENFEEVSRDYASGDLANSVVDYSMAKEEILAVLKMQFPGVPGDIIDSAVEELLSEFDSVTGSLKISPVDRRVIILALYRGFRTYHHRMQNASWYVQRMQEIERYVLSSYADVEDDVFDILMERAEVSHGDWLANSVKENIINGRGGLLGAFSAGVVADNVLNSFLWIEHGVEDLQMKKELWELLHMLVRAAYAKRTLRFGSKDPFYIWTEFAGLISEIPREIEILRKRGVDEALIREYWKRKIKFLRENFDVMEENQRFKAEALFSSFKGMPEFLGEIRSSAKLTDLLKQAIEFMDHLQNYRKDLIKSEDLVSSQRYYSGAWLGLNKWQLKNLDLFNRILRGGNYALCVNLTQFSDDMDGIRLAIESSLTPEEIDNNLRELIDYFLAQGNKAEFNAVMQRVRDYREELRSGRVKRDGVSPFWTPATLREYFIRVFSMKPGSLAIIERNGRADISQPAYTHTVYLGQFYQHYRKNKDAEKPISFKRIAAFIKELLGLPISTSEKNNTSRRINKAINQISPDSYIFLRELLQNSRDAIIQYNSEDRDFNVDLYQERRDGKSLVFINVRDGVGMTFDQLRRFLFVLGTSSKAGVSGMEGHWGAGFFTVFRDAKEVLIKTSTGNGEVIYVRMTPVLKEGTNEVVDVKVELEAKQEEGFKGTIIQQVRESEFPMMVGASVQARLISYGGFMDPGIIKINLSGKTVNTNQPAILSEVATPYGAIRIYYLPGENTLTHRNHYMNLIDDDYLSWLNCGYSDLVRQSLLRAGIVIDIPEGLEPIQDRSDIENRTQALRQIGPQLRLAGIRALIRLFLLGKISLPEIPYDIFVSGGSIHVPTSILSDAQDIARGIMLSEARLKKYERGSEAITLLLLAIPIYEGQTKSMLDIIIAFLRGEITEENLPPDIKNILSAEVKSKKKAEADQKQQPITHKFGARTVGTLNEEEVERETDVPLLTQYNPLNPAHAGFEGYFALAELTSLVGYLVTGDPFGTEFYSLPDGSTAHASSKHNRLSWNVYTLNTITAILNLIINAPENDFSGLYELLRIIIHEAGHVRERGMTTHNAQFNEVELENNIRLLAQDPALRAFLKEWKEKYKGRLINQKSVDEFAAFLLSQVTPNKPAEKEVVISGKPGGEKAPGKSQSMSSEDANAVAENSIKVQGLILELLVRDDIAQFLGDEVVSRFEGKVSGVLVYNTIDYDAQHLVRVALRHQISYSALKKMLEAELLKECARYSKMSIGKLQLRVLMNRVCNRIEVEEFKKRSDQGFSGKVDTEVSATFAAAFNQARPVDISPVHMAVLQDPAMGPDFKAPEVRLVSREAMNRIAPDQNVLRQGNQVLVVDEHWQAQSDQEKLDILMHEAMADWMQRIQSDQAAEDIAIDLEGLKVDEAKRRAAHKGAEIDVAMEGAAEKFSGDFGVEDAQAILKLVTGNQDTKVEDVDGYEEPLIEGGTTAKGALVYKHVIRLKGEEVIFYSKEQVYSNQRETTEERKKLILNEAEFSKAAHELGVAPQSMLFTHADGSVELVTAQAPGKYLYQLDLEAFSDRGLQEIIENFANAIATLHANGIVHNDLVFIDEEGKPGLRGPHVIVDKANRVTLIDFGLAHKIAGEGEFENQENLAQGVADFFKEIVPPEIASSIFRDAYQEAFQEARSRAPELQKAVPELGSQVGKTIKIKTPRFYSQDSLRMTGKNGLMAVSVEIKDAIRSGFRDNFGIECPIDGMVELNDLVGNSIDAVMERLDTEYEKLDYDEQYFFKAKGKVEIRFFKNDETGSISVVVSNDGFGIQDYLMQGWVKGVYSSTKTAKNPVNAPIYFGAKGVGVSNILSGAQHRKNTAMFLTRRGDPDSSRLFRQEPEGTRNIEKGVARDTVGTDFILTIHLPKKEGIRKDFGPLRQTFHKKVVKVSVPQDINRENIHTVIDAMQSQLIEAANADAVVELDLTNIGKTKNLDEANQALFILFGGISADLFERLDPNFETDIGTVINELLKNAFVHGSKQNLNYPIFFEIVRSADKRKILGARVYDVSADETPSSEAVESAKRAQLHSITLQAGAKGLDLIKQNYDYQLSQIFDTKGVKVGGLASAIEKAPGTFEPKTAAALLDNNPAENSPGEIDSSKDTKGGIDFRGLPIITQPIIAQQAAKTINLNKNEKIALNLDSQWQEIEIMLNGGIIPSLERIKEYVSSSCKSVDCRQRLELALSAVADILRLEEERSSSTEEALKQMLILLESNKTSIEIEVVLAEVNVSQKEPVLIN
jgi:tRNA A-37 threonylcarbamoyl transferase component Bud32